MFIKKGTMTNIFSSPNKKIWLTYLHNMNIKLRNDKMYSKFVSDNHNQSLIVGEVIHIPQMEGRKLLCTLF